MTREMTNGEVIAVVEVLVGSLREPVPDPVLFQILYSVPLSPTNMAKILGVVATTAATATLRAAGVDLDDPADRARFGVRSHTVMPPDDTPDWEKTAGELVAVACGFVLTDPDPDSDQAQALADACSLVALQGPDYLFRTLAATLAHLRRLLHGDMRGLVIA